MENKTVNQPHEILTKNLIALCYILDDYIEFNKDLRNLISTKYNRDDIWHLYKISNKKNIIGANKVKKFYQRNKDVVDLINRYSNILEFINNSYNCTGKPIESSSLDFFYQYIMNNKNNLEKMLAVLNRIKELGFKKLIFDENVDFTNAEYKINTKFEYNINIEYLDNMKANPNYHNDAVRYKTTESNYKIIIKSAIHNAEIVVNSLVFDANRLPNSISKEDIFNEILALKNSKLKECDAIKNSIDLNLNMEGLILHFFLINDIINRINDIENKDELLIMLAEMQTILDKLKMAASNYGIDIVKTYPTITPDILQKEKKLYLERIEWDKIDTD